MKNIFQIHEGAVRLNRPKSNVPAFAAGLGQTLQPMRAEDKEPTINQIKPELQPLPEVNLSENPVFGLF